MTLPGLQRHLNFRSALAIVIGGVIGSGVFMKPALMAGQLGSAWLLLGVWVLAGIITLFGALTNAEAAAMFPETGGQYVFFRKMYGDGFAFLYGWACFAVINTAGNASIAYVCSQYVAYFFELPRLAESVELAWNFHLPFIGTFYPLSHLGLKLLTVFFVVAFSFVNFFSLKGGAGLQRMLTLLKALAIFALIAGLLTQGTSAGERISDVHPSFSLAAFMAAMAGAFWAYDGWNNITFVAGEIKNPSKNIPLSLLAGLVFCILAYFLLNLAFFKVLGIGGMAASPFVASDAAFAVWGSTGAGLIALMVILSTLGTVNANVLTTSRVTYSMAEDNKLFSTAGKLHPRYNTPGRALLFNAAWSCLLIFSGSFDMLTDMLIFVSWLFYGMSAFGVFILRKRLKEQPRPYKVWAYPLVPAIFVAFTATFLVSTLYYDITDYNDGNSNIIRSGLGLLITLAGIPVYLFFRKNRPGPR